MRIYNYFGTKWKLLWHYRSHFLQLITPDKILDKNIITFAKQGSAQNYEEAELQSCKAKLDFMIQKQLILLRALLGPPDLSTQHRHFDTKKQSVWPWGSVSGHRELRTFWESQKHPPHESFRRGRIRHTTQRPPRGTVETGNSLWILHSRLHHWHTAQL